MFGLNTDLSGILKPTWPNNKLPLILMPWLIAKCWWQPPVRQGCNYFTLNLSKPTHTSCCIVCGFKCTWQNSEKYTYICISLINEILDTKTKERSHIIWKKSGCTCHLAQEGLEPHLGGWMVYTLPHCSLLPNMRFNFIIILLQSWERVTHLLSVPTESVRPQIIWRSAPLDTLHGNYRERGT